MLSHRLMSSIRDIFFFLIAAKFIVGVEYSNTFRNKGINRSTKPLLTELLILFQFKFLIYPQVCHKRNDNLCLFVYSYTIILQLLIPIKLINIATFICR